MTSDPVISIDKSKKVPVYTVRKLLTDEETSAKKGVFIKDSMYPVVLTEDADVYTEDGALLLRFRKNVLSQNAIDDAYEALKDWMKHKTTDRGIASGWNSYINKKYRCRILYRWSNWMVQSNG